MKKPKTDRRLLAILAPLLVGSLLLVSATFKTEQFVVETHLGEGIFSSRVLVATLIECELLLGIWLISGLYSRNSRLVAIGVFFLFAVVTLQKGLSGEVSCGCFGRLQINPWWTLAIDMIALALLIRWQPVGHRGGSTTPRRSHLAVSFFAVLLACGTSLAVIAGSTPSQLTNDGMILGSGDLVILEPEEWIGQPLPIAQHIDIGDQLLEGHWIVVIYHHDCPKCQEALPKYEQLAHRLTQMSDNKKIAVIEVPPYGIEHVRDHFNATNTYGRLADNREWFVQAPVEIVVENGIVKSTSLDLPSLGTAENGLEDAYTSVDSTSG